MHNSLFIRDLLKRTNADPLRRERRDPHRLMAVDAGAEPAAGEIRLAGEWRVVAAGPAGQELAADLSDFLGKMGVPVRPGARNVIEAAVDPGIEGRDFRFTCTDTRIRLEASCAAGSWAGVAWLEWEMRTRRGPIVPRGVFYRRAAWPVQISQGPWGGNYSVPDFSPEYLSDDAFRLYAHYGVNSMMIYGDLLCYVRSRVFPELDCGEYDANIAMLQDAARRAMRYGVQFSYLVVGPKLRVNHPLFQRLPDVRGTGLDSSRGVVDHLVPGDHESKGSLHVLCSEHPLTAEFYRETFANLFTRVPELAGLILIVGGESMYHCRMWDAHRNTLPCPRCHALTTEKVVADLTGVVRQAVTSVQPKAWVGAWAYNTSGWDHPDRLEMVRQLPDGVAVFHHVEKDQQHRKPGYTKHIWDYSIDFTGPSDNLREIARVTRERGLPLIIKTETGVGLEVFQFPYVPALQHLADKWERVRELKPSGVHQSWLFFGMFNSRAEALGLWAAYGGELGRDEFLRRLARRDFGPQAAGHVLRAWEEMSRAVQHLPVICLTIYYVGPSFLGPAHPLAVAKSGALPDVFHGHLFYLLEHEESFSHGPIDQARTCLVMDALPDARALGIQWEGPGDGWDIILGEYQVAARQARAAWQHLQDAAAVVSAAADRANLREEALLTELVYRTFRSCAATIEFLSARQQLEKGDGSALEAMKAVARDERQNALDAVPLYRQAPWLDTAARTDGRFASCVDMIEAKVRLIDEFLATGK